MAGGDSSRHGHDGPMHGLSLSWLVACSAYEANWAWQMPCQCAGDSSPNCFCIPPFRLRADRGPRDLIAAACVRRRLSNRQSSEIVCSSVQRVTADALLQALLTPPPPLSRQRNNQQQQQNEKRPPCCSSLLFGGVMVGGEQHPCLGRRGSSARTCEAIAEREGKRRGARWVTVYAGSV